MIDVQQSLEVLRRVRKAIRLDWWPGEGRRQLRVGEGGECIVMHIGTLARSLDAEPYPSMWTLAKHLGSMDRTDLSAIAQFNDSHTHAEVLALLDDVIARLEEQTFGSPLPPMTQPSREKVA